MKVFLRLTALCLVLPCVLQMVALPATPATETNGIAAPTNTASGPALTNVQEELRLTQQALEQLRKDLDQSATRNAAAITASLSALEPTLVRLQNQQNDQMAAVRSSNNTVLIVAGVFAGVGFVALLCIVVVLVRALGRFSELAASAGAPRAMLPGGSAPPALAANDMAHLNATAVEQASTRFQHAIDQLQKRIFELEHTSQPGSDATKALAQAAVQPALNISPLPAREQNGTGKPTEPTTPVEPAGRTGLLLGKGQALLNLDQADQALECFDEILAVDPNHTETLIRRGLALEKLQQWEKALESYDRAIALDNSLTVAFLYKGGVCNKLQRHREALESYEKALHTEKRSRAS